MGTLQAKKRDMSIKAKKLRRQGMLSASITGKAMLPNSLCLTLNQNEVAQLMKKNNVGSRVTIEVEGDKSYNTIIKNVDYDPLNHQYLDITFQQLVADEKIKSKAEIYLENESAVQGFLNRGVSEIEYEAYPADLFDRIEIDCSQYKIGDTLTVGDLEVSKNDRIHVLTPADANVLHILEHRHVSAAEQEAEAEAAAESEGTAAAE